MIKRLKLQITATITVILSALLTVILLVVNFMSNAASYTEAYELLDLIATAYGETDVVFENEHSMYKNTNFFSVLFSPDGDVINIKKNMGSEFSDEELVSLCEKILATDVDRGSYDRFLFATRNFIGGSIVVVMDNAVNLYNLRTVRSNSMLVGIIGFIVILWMAYALSDWLVYPVKQTLEKQKQFISDVSHELKTPIAVISANAEVLEGEMGENKWLGYIRSESDRMRGLVNNLLVLSRFDSTGEAASFEKFNLSKTLEGSAMPFECVAFEKGINFECISGENIIINGNEDSIKQVIAILIDNAIKHCYPQGEILVRLKQVRGKAVLEVSNTGDEIPKESRSRIFERFYRVDEARNSENGGHGLGLAIAKTIVEKHHGNISVECAGGFTKFKIVI